MKNFKMLIIGLSFGISIACIADPQIVIERFQPERDKEAVMKIINDNAEYLAYESMGCENGTTEKYIMSSNYTTDVLREDDKTVGFINYLYNNRTVCTFQLPISGLIHLMGVDKDSRSKGYGKQLFDHAMSELETRNLPLIFLAVNKENKVAIELYKKAGFANDLEELLAENQENGILKVIFEKTSQLIYTKKFDIDPDLLLQGNIIQRHPKKLLLAIVLMFCVAYKGLKRQAKS